MKKKTFIVQLLDSKKPSRTSFTQVEDALFYSNDTDASLVFIPHEDTFDFESAKVVMFNLGDESLVERDAEVTTEDGRKVASYELPAEIISHWGDWIAQPVFISGGEIYSGAIVPFSVERHLMHERPPKLTEVVTVTKFVEQSQELVNAMIQAEAQRITEEQTRQSAEANRVQAENERSDKYESYAQQFNDVILDLSEEKDYHSLPEIAGARGGFDTLGARLNNTTAQLAETTTQVNTRIDNIIATPTSVSVQEIIDARQGEDSLGTNISKVKSEVDHKIANIIRQGVETWTPHDATIEDKGTSYRVVGDGNNSTIRAEQRFSDGYVGGNKIYVKAELMSGRDRIFNVGMSLYNFNITGSEVSRTTERFPIQGEWYSVDDIIELPTVGNGHLAVQVNAGHLNKDGAKYSFFDFRNVVVLDLTKIFGIGNEPSLEDVRSILKDYPNETLIGKAKLEHVLKSGINNKINKSDINTLTSEFETTNNLPINFRKFNEETTSIFDSKNENINNKSNMYKDYTKTVEGKETFRLFSHSSTAFFNHNRSLEDLTDADYIDMFLYVNNLDKMDNLQIDFINGDNSRFVSLNLAPLLKEVSEDGYRVLRIPKSHFVTQGGTPSWNNIKDTRVTLISDGTDTCAVYLGKIEASRLNKGAVYMYFDDALKSVYDNALPIMEKYGLKGTLPVITSRPNVNPKYMTWQQIREVEQAGWLVASHGHNSYSLATSSPAVIREELRRSHQELFDRGFIFGSRCFVAPQTSWSDEVDEIAREYYALCRTYSYLGIRDGYRQEFPQSHPRAQYGYSPTVNDTAGTWINSIDQAINDKKEIAISWHGIDNGGTYTNSPEMFDEVCAHIRQRIDEGVLECVTWQDTMLQSKNINSIDVEGNQYLVSDNGQPTVLTLPID